MQPSDPSQQWQQPGYPPQGPPQGAPQSGPPSGPFYPASGVPYPTQPSAPPFQPSAPPFQPSAPPYQQQQYTQAMPAQAAQPPQYPQQPYNQPPFGQPQQPVPVASPPRRGSWPVVLIAGIGALAVMAIAIVAVIAFRSDDSKSPATGPVAGSSASKGGFDQCLVGKWTQTDYQHNVELSDTEVGKREKLGKIKFTGGGLKWDIKADGTAAEDDSDQVYTGKTDDGRTITASGEGTVNWKLTIEDRKIYFAGISGTSAITISIDGAFKGRIEFQPNQDPIPYTCTNDVWRTTSETDSAGFTTYERVK